MRDVGIFSDLDRDVRISLPAGLTPSDVRIAIDARHRLLLLQAQDVVLKAYPLCGTATVNPGSGAAALSFDCLTRADSAELRAVVAPSAPVQTRADEPTRATDADDDGLPDALDVLLGARKLVANGAAYTEGYYRIGYPRGDVPRTVGVCSDTIVRAFRNAGIDLQVRVAEDIRGDRAAYAGITRPDPNIDHRRVKNLLRWFVRHVPQVRAGPHRPGDVVFLDTFPSRPAPITWASSRIEARPAGGRSSSTTGPSGLTKTRWICCQAFR